MNSGRLGQAIIFCVPNYYRSMCNYFFKEKSDFIIRLSSTFVYHLKCLFCTGQQVYLFGALVLWCPCVFSRHCAWFYISMYYLYLLHHTHIQNSMQSGDNQWTCSIKLNVPSVIDRDHSQVPGPKLPTQPEL